MIDVREYAIDPAAFVQPRRTVERCWDSLRSTRSPVLVVDTGMGRSAAAALQVRAALQDRIDPLTPIERLIDARLILPSRDLAMLRLSANRSLSAVVIAGQGAPIVVERSVAPIREAVVMAGGFGRRLRPLTDDTPKPLLDVGGRPLLCRILDSLREAGVERVHLSVHYLAERVRALIGDGRGWNLDVEYLEEHTPLGTGAGLSLLRDVVRPFFVVNGDVLTDADWLAFGRHHQLEGNLATVATYLHAAPLPYGVVEQRDGHIVRIDEKPVYRYPINAGLYAFAPRVLEHLTHGQPLAMVDFLNQLARRERVGRFPLVEYWNDVGSLADYERAQQEVSRL